MMMIASSRNERSFVPETDYEFKPEYPTIESKRSLNVRHFQVYVADAHALADWSAAVLRTLRVVLSWFHSKRSPGLVL
jgi:hypothetical protein